MEIENDGEQRKESFTSRTVKTVRNSEVTLGYSKSSNAAVLRFKNNQGTVTVFGLSEEAFDALKMLINIPKAAFMPPPETVTWRVVVDGIVEAGAATVTEEGKAT